jgi:aryl-alcohol dehydrogenase-like predicted oxidoreductase
MTLPIVKLGRTGLEVSHLCLGCMSCGVPERGTHPWTLGEAESRPFLKRALDMGFNFFDTANVFRRPEPALTVSGRRTQGRGCRLRVEGRTCASTFGAALRT